MKKPRRSRAEWIEICQALEASGEAPAAFARRRGLNRSTLWSWLSTLRQEGALCRRSAAFVEVVAEAEAPSQPQPAAVIRVGPVVIEFSDRAPEPAWVAELAARC